MFALVIFTFIHTEAKAKKKKKYGCIVKTMEFQLKMGIPWYYGSMIHAHVDIYIQFL